MAGTAFLPWERWLTQLLHPLYVRARKWYSERERSRLLLRSRSWPEARGTISSVQWDSSPREGLWYSYTVPEGYYSGLWWKWFDSGTPIHVLAGDGIVLRYNPSNPDESVIIGYEPQHSEIIVPAELRN